MLFPVLVDCGDSVDVKVQFDEHRQYHKSIRGYCRLVLLQECDAIKYLTSQFHNDRSLQLYSINLGNLNDFRELLFLTAVRETFFNLCPLPETEESFQQIVASQRQHFVPKALHLMDLVSNALALRHHVQLRVEALEHRAFQATREDIEQQLLSLFDSDFPFSFSSERLPDLSRYLDGIAARLDRLSGKLKRDLAAIEEIARWQDRLTRLLSGLHEPQQNELFHFLQEYRLSLFCQEKKTRIKMSPKRLEQEFTRWESAKRE